MKNNLGSSWKMMKLVNIPRILSDRRARDD
jgi:hypothetical protein